MPRGQVVVGAERAGRVRRADVAVDGRRPRRARAGPPEPSRGRPGSGPARGAPAARSVAHLRRRTSTRSAESAWCRDADLANGSGWPSGPGALAGRSAPEPSFHSAAAAARRRADQTQHDGEAGTQGAPARTSTGARHSPHLSGRLRSAGHENALTAASSGRRRDRTLATDADPERRVEAESTQNASATRSRLDQDDERAAPSPVSATQVQARRHRRGGQHARTAYPGRTRQRQQRCGEAGAMLLRGMTPAPHT